LNQRKLRDLKAGESFMGFYLIKSKRVKTTREGAIYLDIDLQDSSGSLNAKIWSDVDKYQAEFERGDVVKVEGVIEEYKEQLQVRVKRLRKARPEDAIELTALQPASRHSIEQMEKEIREILAEVKNKDLQNLIKKFFDEPELVEKLKQCPAARNVHHAYLGGLMEHIWRMLKSAKALVKDVYPDLNYDLVITGTFIHDLGKLLELESTPVISISRAGYLEGHIVLGLKLLERLLREIKDFPSELRLHLEHIIISHHGELEWGSPVVPLTPEAMLIHHIDNLDAKLNMVIDAIDSDLNRAEKFTGYHQILERHLYKGRLKPESGNEE